MTKTSIHHFRASPLALAFTLLTTLLVSSADADSSAKETTMYTIQIQLDGAVLSATIDNNPTAQDFIARLPLTLELKDYASTEKIGFLANKLTTQGSPDGSTPAVGDISYYAPWGNLAIFYKDFAYSQHLVRLGHITSGIEQLNFSGEKHATITLIQSNEAMRIKP